MSQLKLDNGPRTVNPNARSESNILFIGSLQVQSIKICCSKQNKNCHHWWTLYSYNRCNGCQGIFFTIKSLVDFCWFIENNCWKMFVFTVVVHRCWRYEFAAPKSFLLALGQRANGRFVSIRSKNVCTIQRCTNWRWTNKIV